MNGLENISFQLLPPLERAQYFQKLIREHNLSVTTIARKIQRSVPFVSNSLRLLHLPEAVKDGLFGKLISEGHARALGMLKKEEAVFEAYKKILIEHLSVRKTEALVRELKEKFQ